MAEPSEKPPVLETVPRGVASGAEFADAKDPGVESMGCAAVITGVSARSNPAVLIAGLIESGGATGLGSGKALALIAGTGGAVRGNSGIGGPGIWISGAAIRGTAGAVR